MNYDKLQNKSKNKNLIRIINVKKFRYKKEVTQPLTFGAVFTNGKLVPNRVEFLNILQKVQVVELVILN